MQEAVETQRSVANASGKVLRVVTTRYTGAAEPAGVQTYYADDASALAREVDYGYDSYGNRAEEDDYNFTSCTAPTPPASATASFGCGPGALLRKVTHTFLADTSPWIVDKPLSETIYDGSGNTVAATAWEYDVYSGANHAPLTASGAADHDSAYDSGGSITQRGNNTAISRCASFSGGSYASWLSSYAQFDDAGNRVVEIDPAGHATTYSFADAWASGGSGCAPSSGEAASFLSKITDALGHVTSGTYDSCTGELASRTGPNGNTTSYAYGGPWGRITQINFPDSGETTYAYTETTLETKRLMGSSYWTDKLATFDGLGRPAVVARKNGNGGWDRVETCYDGEGNKSYITYPFASSSQGGAAACTQPGDTYGHDALGRAIQVKHPDNTIFNTVYAGRAEETTDEGDGSGPVSKITQRDALGNLAAVCEVTGTAGSVPNSTPSDCNQQISGVSLNIDATGFLTAYQHDARGLLTAVEQPGLANRTLAYDVLSRLLSATNPENGTVSYTYDSDSNVVTKTRADGVTVDYSYDALNRPTGRSFSVNGSPDPADTVHLYYDTDPTGLTTYNTIGRLTRVSNGSPVVLSFNQYDAMGRAQVLDTIVNGTTYHSDIGFDGIGFPSYQRLPSGRVLWLDENARGLTTWIQDQDSAKTTYVHNRYYEAWGAPSDSDLGNGLHQGWHHDSRMRLTETDVYPNGAYNWNTQLMDIVYTYNPDSTVATLTDEMGSSAEAYSFAFDPLGRLSGWSTGAGLSCTFGLDRYGNLVDTSGNPSCGMLTGKSVNASNQIAGNVYDASGLPLSDTAGSSYSWNVEGELAGFQQSGEPAYTYLYDGLGRRVEKLQNGAVEAVYLRNALGQVASELEGTAFTDEVISPSDGARIAAVEPDGTVLYYHTGGVGTTRDITTGSGVNLVACGQDPNHPAGTFFTYAPFGAETGGCTQSTVPYKFTGKYRDSESVLDDFGARYYQSNLGRFLSPDWSPTPEAVPYASLENPQSLNLYSYALNDPMTNTDPNGHWCLFGKIGTTCGSQKTPPPSSPTTPNEVAAAKAGQITGQVYAGIVERARQHPIEFAIAAAAVGSEAGASGDALDAVEGAEAADAAVDSNKLHHIFDDPDHGLDAVVSAFGSQEKAYAALRAATESAVQVQGLTGEFETTVEVGGQSVKVIGVVMNGTARIGTAYIPRP